MLTIWPIRGRETVSGCDGIWSKVKVTLTILRRKQVLCSPRLGIFVGWEKRRCALDSILVNLNKTISCGSGLCLCRPATRSWSNFQASHWSSGACEGLSLAADDRGANCDRRWSNYLISIPLQLSLSSPSLCRAHYHIFISLFSWEFPDSSLISPARLSGPDSRDLWEDISEPAEHFNILFWQFSSPSTQHPRDEKWSLLKSSSCAHTWYAWVFIRVRSDMRDIHIQV